MAHLWTHVRDEGWKALALSEGCYALGGDPGNGISVQTVGHATTDPALIRADDAAGRERWVLVSATRLPVRINGQRVPGIRVLDHRDEVRLPGIGEFYFSAERLARVEPYAGPDASCPRCKNPLNHGDPAVVCPKCGVAHHQMDGWHCWTHLEHCQLCDQPTRLDAGLRWSPDEL